MFDTKDEQAVSYTEFIENLREVNSILRNAYPDFLLHSEIHSLKDNAVVKFLSQVDKAEKLLYYTLSLPVNFSLTGENKHELAAS